jgi:PAT family beta-lactamase induction signal transducer AmpG
MKTVLPAGLQVYLQRRILTMFFFGFSSGLPLLLVFSTLSYWMRDIGVSLTTIGLFAIARSPYSLKFLWAPLIDRMPVPGITTRFGRRRGWALITQVAVMIAIVALGATDPTTTPFLTALFAMVVAFCSASQDIVIDAFRVDLLDDEEQGAGAAMAVQGYRIGLLVAGGGAIGLSAALDWSIVYAVMAVCITVGMIAVLLTPEPPEPEEDDTDAPEGERQIAGFFRKAVIAPFRDFMTRPGWLAILVFIMLYKLGDAYLGTMANPFYIDMGFTDIEVAAISKGFGLASTIIGALIGGAVVYRYGIIRALLFCGILAAASNLVFVAQAQVGHSVPMLIATIACENVAGAMSITAFVAYMSSLCNLAYTATQYALLTSFMAAARDLLSASSGWTADMLGWTGFFLFTTAIALPGLVLLVWMTRRFPAPAKEDSASQGG